MNLLYSHINHKYTNRNLVEKAVSNWKEAILKPEDTLEKAIRVLDQVKEKIILISDDQGRLLGTITDGDIRRALIKHVEMKTLLVDVMFKEPTSASVRDDYQTILEIMKSKDILHIPILDSEKKIIGLETLQDLVQDNNKHNPVVLMAGGFGKRLEELTTEIPKPLLKIGDKPILETILEQLIENGFVNFFISTHYLAEKIRKYFGDGSKWGVSIQYIYEEKPLGTAGALGLLPKNLPDHPIIMMNGDLLTKLNIELMLKYHIKQAANATVCVTKHHLQVPFGVINHKNQNILSIDEKPIHRFFINAGIYILDASLVKSIKGIKYMDMPEFLGEQIEKGSRIKMFPVHEYWIDIGGLNEYEIANKEMNEWNL